MVLALAPQFAEVRQADPVLGDPFVGELPGLDIRQDLFHRFPGFLADDFFPSGHIAVLSRVADRVAHVGDAALVDQIDDQLHLMQALEIGHLRRIARFDQGLEARAHQLGEPATQDRLFAEEVGLRLFPEVGLQQGSPTATEGRAVGERDLFAIA